MREMSLLDLYREANEASVQQVEVQLTHVWYICKMAAM